MEDDLIPLESKSTDITPKPKDTNAALTNAVHKCQDLEQIESFIPNVASLG